MRVSRPSNRRTGRLRPCGFAALLLALTLTLSSCEKTTLTHQALQFNKTVQQHRLEQLFLNVIRAAKREPMAMTAVNILTTTNQSSASGSIGFPFGPLSQGPYSGGFNARRSQNPKLDLLILDNDDEVVKGFMEPVGSETINYFLNQGWNHEMLAYLFVEAIDGRLEDFGHEERNEISRCYQGNPPNLVHIPNDAADPLFTYMIRKHLPNLELHADGFHIVDSKVRLRTRSPQGIRYYLGELTRICLKDEGGEIPVVDGKPLFLVEHAPQIGPGKAVAVPYRGRFYSIPHQPENRSLSALTLVQQLVNLQTKKVQPATSTIQLIDG